MKRILAALLCVAIWAPVCQAQGRLLPDTLHRGELEIAVPHSGQAGLVYALYLPKQYTPTRTWPVVYCVDPDGRGTAPLEQFRAGADAYGYILVGLYSYSRDNPNAGLISLPLVIAETRARFSINPQRMYFAGLGSGARFAYTFARQRGGAAVLLLCGAGINNAYPLSRAVPFGLVLAAGQQDMNFAELQTLTGLASELGLPNRMFVFGGGHTWPPPATCTEMLYWLQVDAYKRKLEPAALLAQLKPELIAQFAQRLSKADSVERSGYRYTAFLQYTALATDYTDVLDADIAMNSAARFKSDPAVEDSLLAVNTTLSTEQLFRGQIDQGFSSILYGTSAKPMSFWRELNGNLSNQAQQAVSIMQSTMARRLVTYLTEGLFEYTEQQLRARQYDKAEKLAEVWQLVQPERFQGYYVAALSYAQLGRKNRALEKLDEAVTHGFRNARLVEQEKLLEPIRQEADYLRILSRMRAGS